MVEGADAVSVTDCIELYVPDPGDADTVGGGMIVYPAVKTGPVLEPSFAKNFKVALLLIVIPDTGLGPLVLDMVGVEPSVV